MLDVLVVAPRPEQLAPLVDALCELPGVQVRATAGDVRTACGLLSRSDFDVVIGTSSLACGGIAMLVEEADDAGTAVMVLATESPLLPGLADYWRDLGARHVVDSLAEIAARVSDYVRDGERSRQLADHVEAALAIQARASSSVGMSGLGALLTGGERKTRAPQVVALGSLLHESLRAFGRMIVPQEVNVILDVDRNLPRVRCVPRELERIVLHLLLAACDALPLGGTVWLVVERDGPRHVRIEVLESSGRPRDPRISVEVIRALATKQQAEVRVVDHASGATSIQVIVPAVVPPPS